MKAIARRSVCLLCLCLAVLSAAGCAPVAGPADSRIDQSLADLEQIVLGVGFVPSVQFAPLYVGIEKGYYEDAGLDLQMAYGYENDYLKLVGTEEAQFMIGSGDQVIIGRGQGLPVRYVMRWFTKYPVVVVALADKGIDSPEDLAGRRIGIPGPFGASYVAFRGILEAAGLTERDIKMESIGFTQAAALAEGTVDAAVDYAANGPIVLAAEGFDTTQIVLDDYIKIPANGLVTNEKTIRERPDLVRSMVHATVKAIQYTLDHPDEAFEITLRYVPEAGGENREINRAVFDASLEYWRPTVDMAIGESNADDWRSAAGFMRRTGLVDSQLDERELFTNEFVP